MAESLSNVTRAVLDEVFDSHSRRQLSPGLAAALQVDGELVWSRRAGRADIRRPAPVTEEIRFPLASVTKLVTTATVMRLVELDLLSLDAPVADYLPSSLSAHVTPRTLLAHSSGLEREPTCGSVLAPREVFPAWTRWKYSNVGFGLLGHLIERLVGADLLTAYQELILAPLHLADRFGWGSDDEVAPIGHYIADNEWAVDPGHPIAVIPAAGGLWATADSIAIFTGLVASPRAGLLTETSMRSMWQPLLVCGETLPAPAQGLGWVIDRCGDLQVVGHSGSLSGFSSCTLLEPESRLGAAVVTNAPGGQANELAKSLVATAHERLPASSAVGKPMPDSHRLWVGTYHGAGATFLIVWDGDRLVVQTPDHVTRARLEVLDSGAAIMHGGIYDGELVRLNADPLPCVDVCSYRFSRATTTQT